MHFRSPRLVILGLVLLCLLTAPAFAWNGCDHKAERTAAIDTAGAHRIVIEARAGDLDVRAGTGSQIRARGVACADRARDLDDVRIVTERDGDVVRVIADIPDTSGWNNNAWLDLEVDVPADVPVEIRDSSGDIKARGIHLTRVDDSSGDFDGRDTRGDLRVDDSSGDVYLTGHKGDVHLADSSGDLRLRDIDGSVRVDHDSSGDITADHVTGSVIVESDSSGDIRVSDIDGDFEVQHDGSGDVDYRDVKGHVDVPADR